MLVDMWFKTRGDAKERNDSVEPHWKFMGTAEEKDRFIAWRTDSKAHFQRLLKREGWMYENLFNIIIDKATYCPRGWKRKGEGCTRSR